MTTFAQLPALVQQAFLSDGPYSTDDLADEKFKLAQVHGYNGIWVAPQLCYDFNESNYSLHVINLKEVSKLNTGPALATAYVKSDPVLPAWIVIAADEGDIDNQVYECV